MQAQPQTTTETSLYAAYVASFPGSPRAWTKSGKERGEPGKILSREKRHR